MDIQTHQPSSPLYWNDEDEPDRRHPEQVVDIRFTIDCKRIPVDHAYALASALQQRLPWLSEEPGVAVHTVHVAGSQNGWERPEHGTDSCLSVSRRTKLTLRAPLHRVEALLRELPGSQLDIAGHALVVGSGKVKSLTPDPTLFARHVAFDSHATTSDEGAFLAWAAQRLAECGVRVRKALCGKTLMLATPQGPILTRSLMLAGLTPDESNRLQEQGLGAYRLLGCGIFVPHKSIEAVKHDRD